MPSVILHEMAHAFHWRQGHFGSELSPITSATYEKAMKDGKYDCVKHWHGSLCNKHYATTNHLEYFAETVEAYFSSDKFRNELFPFNRA